MWVAGEIKDENKIVGVNNNRNLAKMNLYKVRNWQIDWVQYFEGGFKEVT